MELLEKTILEIDPLDIEACRSAEDRIGNLTMPEWALGRICDLAVRLSGITGTMPPAVGRRVVVTMAGDHGIVREGVSLHGSEVTRQMVNNIAGGGAGVNVLARLNGARVIIADLGMIERDETLVEKGLLIDKNVGKGTDNFATGPAMNRESAILSVEKGIEMARDLAADVDVFAIGEMGIGNTSPATAIAACLTRLPVATLCGPGTGLDQSGLAHKIKMIQKGLQVNRPNPADALDVLAKVGGFEIGGMAGLILGAAACRRPVLVDGFVATASAMIARSLCLGSAPYMILSHTSAEPGHLIMCEWLSEKPLLDLGMRLGEGTGAAMAMNVVAAAAAILTDMATFDSAGVDARIC